MKTTILPPSLILLIFFAPVFLIQAATQIVVPNAGTNIEGNSSASDVLTASSFRMQMVFDASQFGALSAVSNSGPSFSNWSLNSWSMSGLSGPRF